MMFSLFRLRTSIFLWVVGGIINSRATNVNPYQPRETLNDNSMYDTEYTYACTCMHIYEIILFSILEYSGNEFFI